MRVVTLIAPQIAFTSVGLGVRGQPPRVLHFRQLTRLVGEAPGGCQLRNLYLRCIATAGILDIRTILTYSHSSLKK